jgi:hypothetical protein
VKYNPTLTEKTTSDIKALAETTISNFNTNNLQKFDSVFRHSNLLRDLDNTDNSILSNLIAIIYYINLLNLNLNILPVV